MVVLVHSLLFCVCREMEVRLEKQRATRKFIDEFLQKREEVCKHLFAMFHYWSSGCTL